MSNKQEILIDPRVFYVKKELMIHDSRFKYKLLDVLHSLPLSGANISLCGGLSYIMCSKEWRDHINSVLALRHEQKLLGVLNRILTNLFEYVADDPICHTKPELIEDSDNLKREFLQQLHFYFSYPVDTSDDLHSSLFLGIDNEEFTDLYFYCDCHEELVQPNLIFSGDDWEEDIELEQVTREY